MIAVRAVWAPSASCRRTRCAHLVGAELFHTGENVFAFATEGVGRSVVALQIFRQPSESRVRDCAAAALDRGRINAFARKLDVDPEALGRLGIGMLGLARNRPRMYGFNENLTLKWRPGRGAILFAELTGLPLQTERQCRHAMRAFWPR